MKNINLKIALLALILVFFIQNGSIILPDLPKDTHSEEELISPQNDTPYHDTHIT